MGVVRARRRAGARAGERIGVERRREMEGVATRRARDVCEFGGGARARGRRGVDVGGERFGVDVGDDVGDGKDEGREDGDGDDVHRGQGAERRRY